MEPIEGKLTTNRTCPKCGKMVISEAKTRKAESFRNGVIGFGSVDTTCVKCNEHIVCGYLGRGNYVIVTSDYRKEINKRC